MDVPSNPTSSDWFNTIERGDIVTIQEMIKAHAGDRTEAGETALMIACRMNRPDLVGILIPSEIGLRTVRDEDALIVAAQFGACKVLALLLAYTSIYRTTAGLSALDIAIQRNDAASLRILLRHPSLTLEDIQYAYDYMPPTTLESVQQLILTTLRNKGVHREMKRQLVQAEGLDTNQEIQAMEYQGHGLELSLTPNVSIWDASTVDQRLSKHASTQKLSGIEEETTCSMSFLQNIQTITSESSSSTYDRDNTVHEIHKPLCSDKSAAPKVQECDNVLLDSMRDSKIHNKNEHVQTVYPIFTEAEMAKKSSIIESLRAEICGRQRELEAQQQQNEEQAAIFVSKIEGLEVKVTELTQAHTIEIETLQKEISSLRVVNSSLGEEVAVLCQSASFESLSTLLAAAQQLVRSELPSIHITERADSTSPKRDSSRHSKRSNVDSTEGSLELDKQCETDAMSQRCTQQAQLIKSLQADIAQRDEQIETLKQQNEELKRTIQSQESSISLCNTAVDSLIQSPHMLTTGILLQNTSQSTPGVIINKPKVSTPVRRSIVSPQPENRLQSRSRGSRANVKTPQSPKLIERSHASITSTTSARPTVQMGLKPSSVRPSNVQSPKAQVSPVLRSTRRVLDTTSSREREDTRSPLSDEWMVVAAKNRASSKRWSTHTPLMDTVLFRHNHDIPRHMEYVGCALTNGYTALMFACERDNKVAVSILAPLECGMCLDNGDTALTLALRSEHFETAELLRGLEPSYCDAQNATQVCTDVAGSGAPQKGLRTEMMKYAIEGDVLKIYCLLPHQSREKDEDGNTALIHAVSNNNISAVKLLCTTEAGLHNKKGETALIRAVKNGNVECCLILVDHEKRRQDSKGYTALMWAAVTGDVAMVRLLAPYEAGVQNAQDDNCTALMYAVEFQNFDCAEILAPKEKALEDTRGLSALDRLRRYSGSVDSQLTDAFIRLLS